MKDNSICDKIFALLCVPVCLNRPFLLKTKKAIKCAKAVFSWAYRALLAPRCGCLSAVCSPHHLAAAADLCRTPGSALRINNAFRDDRR
ncbi:hypothetical protein RR46_13041 [Papilio xuthus]|uniref:Uncharacterized protein n=1 Tax=Papilio xuthus TaxID=66420 RepID=A0A194PKB2_PAPXU|nr:hypothetical protein RR46_13041 [Papilio xuthus]